MSKYVVKGLPWNGSIGTDVSDCKTAREVMEKAHLDFFVDKCGLVAKMPFTTNGDNTVNKLMGDFAYDGNVYRPCPDAFATYRTDKNIPLGIVKDKYTVVQNTEAFNFFDDAIGNNQAEWVSAGCFGYGHLIYLVAKLPQTIKVGNVDIVDNYLVFSNSHDGTMSVNILFTPVRVFCFNCLSSARRRADSYIRLKHTTSVTSRLELGSSVIQASLQYCNNISELYTAMYNTKLTDEEVTKYISSLILSKNEFSDVLDSDYNTGLKKLLNKDYMTMERTGISTRKVNQINTILDYYFTAENQQNVIGTAWGAYNAITGYFANVKDDIDIKRMYGTLYGGDSLKMQSAFEEAIELIQ